MTDREIMQQALDALENSVDTVQHEYDADWRHGIPTRKAQLDGMKECLDAHIAAITALRDRLAHCDRCGKRLGGEGDIHTCTPLELRRFEKWWDAKDDIPNDGPYTPDTPIQFAWAGWQAALAQPEQEPVAWMYQCTADNSRPVLLQQKQNWAESGTGLWVESPLYTTPPAAQRKPLTPKEIDCIWDEVITPSNFIYEFVRAIEAAHGIKENT